MLELIQEAILLKISKGINKSLDEAKELDNSVSKKIENLENKKIKVIVTKFFFDFIYIITFERSRLSIRRSNASGEDLTVKLSLGGLVKARFTSIEQAIRERDIEFIGDLNIAIELQSIFKSVEINFREILQTNLAIHTSDSFAWQFVNVLDKVLTRINLKHTEFKEQVTDYLQLEKNILVNKYELNDFLLDVDKLRDDVERLSIRVDRLSANSSC